MIQLAVQLEECGTASPTQLKEVFRLTKEASDLGCQKAKLMLGWMYHEGNGVNRDLEMASQCFHQACAEGNPMALLALAMIYERGDGVAQDLQTAEKYYKLALRVDVARAPVAYANFLAYQYGDQSSVERAASFYKKGCSSDQVEALSRLALLYQHGEGVEKNLAEAEKLRAQARNQLIRLKAADASEYFARASAYGEINETDAAIADYNRALELKPDFRGGYMARGAAWQTVGNNEAACADLTNAIKLAP